LKFIHIADVHLGATPDAGMPWSQERFEAIRNAFQKIIQLTEKKQADLLLIAGDLFHRQPLRRELKEINYLFSTLTYTRVVIIAGNHDYIRENSPYLNFSWSDNVTLLSSGTMTSVYFKEFNTEVHGFSYHQPEIREPLYDSCRAPSDGRIHVLLAHGGDAAHIPISTTSLAGSGFHYIALGHIHQPKIFKNTFIAYAGSLEPLDKTDIGKRGYILGEATLKECKISWRALAKSQYSNLTLTTTRDTTTEELLDQVRPVLAANPNDIYRVQLTGFRDPEITFNRDAILNAGRVVEVLDRTEPEYDLYTLSIDHSHDLISYYIKALSGEDATPIHRKALYYGLRALLNP